MTLASSINLVNSCLGGQLTIAWKKHRSSLLSLALNSVEGSILEGRMREGIIPDETSRLFALKELLDVLEVDSVEGRGVKAPMFVLHGLYTWYSIFTTFTFLVTGGTADGT